MKYYELSFRATYHGMRVLIEACENSEGVELKGVAQVVASPAEAVTPTGRAKPTYPNGKGMMGKTKGGKTGKHIAGEFLRAQPPGKIFTLSDVAQVFVEHGFKAGSASAVMSQLKHQGLVDAGPELGQYSRPLPAAAPVPAS